MEFATRTLSTIWRMVQKDLLRERRSPFVWPSTLMLGVLLVLTMTIHLDLPPEDRERVGGGLFWTAAFFVGALSIERIFLAEREEGCWQALSLYAVSPSMIYLAKFITVLATLAATECVLLPLFAIMADLPLWRHPLALFVLAALANLGFAAVGTLLGAIAGAFRRRGHLLALLLLPLIMPVALGAAEGTRLLAAGDFGEPWRRWLQLLGIFATLYLTAGCLLFEFVLEE